MNNILTQREHNELYQCEQAIARGLTLLTELGAALLYIWDERLYRQKFASFEEYCRKQWGMSKVHRQIFIQAMEAAQSILPETGIAPLQEGFLKPLTRLPIARQDAAWQNARAAQRNGNLTTREVRQAADTLITSELTKGPMSRQRSPARISVIPTNSSNTPS